MEEADWSDEVKEAKGHLEPPKLEEGSWSPPQSPRHGLPPPWSWIAGLGNCENISAWIFNSPVGEDFLQRLE